ncbi:hypothetical protein MNBD_NITROSPIRAE01-954 [hydrothermal vent metagenome]|uniref:PpiC domain-containing protein n=1 Tax=hydrothermal vent metagenome TaxID=652676 RepID=A0A3B1DCZ8_9ZZZZ
MKNCLKHFLKGAFVFALTLTATQNISQAVTAIDRVVAIAGKEVITQSQLDRIIRSRKDAGNPVLASDERWKILKQLIEEQLLIQEAGRKGISVSEEELEFALKDIEKRNKIPNRETLKQAVAQDNMSWNQYVKDLKNQIMAIKLLGREVRTTVSLSDQDIKTYYHEHPEIFGLPDRVKITQILLRIPKGISEAFEQQIKEKAETIYKEAHSGTDFIQLVLEYSEGREKNQEGDLGFFKKGDLTPKIDAEIFRLKEGQITAPIRTPLGIHIFKIEKQEIGKMRPFDTVKKRIKEKLITEETNALRSQWISDLWKRSFVEIK